MTPTGDPLLSVVITIVEGGASLIRCLEALERQEDPPPLEILVPFDDSLTGIDVLMPLFPGVRFLAMGHVETSGPHASARGQHELFDRRRAVGLRAVRGELIGMLEDRGRPDPGWARAMTNLHQALPHAVIGGPVENAVDTIRNWAVYFCDFTRYAPPLSPGPAEWVTDVNVSYKQRAIASTEPLWRERYHEPVVHFALAHQGETLYLSPEPVTRQMRQPIGLGALLRERFAWGRLFAYTRLKTARGSQRIGWLAASPLVPAVVLARQARLVWGKGLHRGRFVAAAPLVALLLVVWAAGEAAGYLTGRP